MQACHATWINGSWLVMEADSSQSVLINFMRAVNLACGKMLQFAIADGSAVWVEKGGSA